MWIKKLEPQESTRYSFPVMVPILIPKDNHHPHFNSGDEFTYLTLHK